MSVDKTTSKQHGEKSDSNQDDQQSQQRPAQSKAKQPDMSRRQRYLAELLGRGTLEPDAEQSGVRASRRVTDVAPNGKQPTG